MRGKFIEKYLEDKSLFDSMNNDYSSMTINDFTYKYKITSGIARRIFGKKPRVFSEDCNYEVESFIYPDTDKELIEKRNLARKKHKITDSELDKLLKNYGFSEILGASKLKDIKDLIVVVPTTTYYRNYKKNENKGGKNTGAIKNS